MKRLSFALGNSFFVFLSFSHPVCSPLFFRKGLRSIIMDWQLGRTRSRSRRNGFFAFSIAIPVISRDYRWKLHGYLAARGRYDRYDRASGRETCSRVTYRPLRSKRAPPSRLLSRLSMLARIRLLFRSRAADRFKRVLYGVHRGRP